MNENVLIVNLSKGLEYNKIMHIQGFPDNAVSSLRGVYALIYPFVKTHYMDPRYKAAAILSLISVAGGLITVTAEGYCCNNGFIDSYCTMYHSDTPVLTNLQLMAENYIDDDYFVDKAIMYYNNLSREEMSGNLRKYQELISRSVYNCCSDEEKNQVHILKLITDMLSDHIIVDIAIQPMPQKWDHEVWLKEFMPIWGRRNRFEQHLFRAKYYQRHVDVVEEGCFISCSGKMVSIPWDADERMRASKMYSDEIQVSPPEFEQETIVDIWHMDCLEAAKKVQSQSDGITAVLNLANRQNPGGGVCTGSGAQEESCFLRSDYFTTLYPFANYANKYDLPKAVQQYPLDRNFGGVWSSDVTVFRGRELEGYPLLDKPWKTNFIAVAAINRPMTVDIDGEIRLHPDMVRGALNKICTIMNIAAENHVSNLILGAMGCGAFRNPPKHIAELFFQVLNEPQHKGRFKKVIFAISSEELCDVFRSVFESGF